MIVHDVKRKEEESVTKSVGSFRRASSIEPVIVGVKPKDSITEESHLYGSKSTGDLHDSPTSGLTGLNLSRSCSCENTSSLRHYGGSANLLDFDTVRSSSLKADPRHGKARSASCTEAGHKLPPLPPRYKRQPTIENSVCFQEVFHFLKCYFSTPNILSASQK